MENIVSPKIDISFDEWVKFVFDHPVSDDSLSAWYWDEQLNEFWEKWTFSEGRITERQLEFATTLFQDAAFLLARYSPEQINQGFWFLLSGHSSFALADFIWNTELAWNLREQCIKSMVKPFQVIFIQIPEQDSCNMWWDLLRNFGDNVDLNVIEAMFQTMIEILQVPSLACQVSALHGLGHIKHNGKRQVVEDYLQVNINLDKETRDYALAAIEGKIL
jgi:hypothetical protein